MYFVKVEIEPEVEVWLKRKVEEAVCRSSVPALGRRCCRCKVVRVGVGGCAIRVEVVVVEVEMLLLL